VTGENPVVTIHRVLDAVTARIRKCERARLTVLAKVLARQLKEGGHLVGVAKFRVDVGKAGRAAFDRLRSILYMLEEEEDRCRVTVKGVWI